MNTIPVDPEDAKIAMVYTDGILDYERHDGILYEMGYRFVKYPCTCDGNDNDGHWPHCGWGRMIAGPGPLDAFDWDDSDFFFVPRNGEGEILEAKS